MIFRDVKNHIPCSSLRRFYIRTTFLLRKSQRPKGGAGNYE